MAVNQLNPLPGYPCPNEKGGIDWIGDVTGPASYVNTGTYGTSGQQINASEFGLGGFESISVESLASDGTTEVIVVNGATVAGALALNPVALSGQPANVTVSAVLHWYNGQRGIGGATEFSNTTNLAAKSVRLRITAV